MATRHRSTTVARRSIEQLERQARRIESVSYSAMFVGRREVHHYLSGVHTDPVKPFGNMWGGQG